MDILIVSQFTAPGSNNRFVSLARMLADQGHDVELAISSFVHETKSQRTTPGVNANFTYSVHYEVGYRKNVSAQRLVSHSTLASSLAKYLQERRRPDVVVCAVPSLSVGAAVLKYCNESGVRLVLDVQDLWPEAFEMVLRPRLLARALLTPIRRKAVRLYRGADEIVTVSRSYSSYVSRLRPDGMARSVYIGTELRDFGPLESIWAQRDEDVFTVAYVGTLAASYQLGQVLDALAVVRSRGIHARLLVLGDGADRPSLEEKSATLGLDVEFVGRLSHGEMAKRLAKAHIAVNPIHPHSAASVINKVGDYAAAGLPVINTQVCSEYREMLSDYDAGVNVAPRDIDGLAHAIEGLARDEEKVRQMSLNARRMGEEVFDRTRLYRKFCDLITAPR